MDTSAPNHSPDAFVKQLVQENLIDAQKASELVQRAHDEGVPVIIYIERHSVLDPHVVATIASRHYALPLYDLSQHNIEQVPKEFLNLPIVQKGYALPIEKKDQKVLVAIADPNTPELEELSFLTGLSVEYVLVAADKLKQTIGTVRGNDFVAEAGALGDDFEEFEISAYADEPNVITSYNINDTPVVRYVNKILLDGVQSKASDIHFEPYERYYRIRYRRDGILYEVSNPPLQLANALVARIKILANLDISEHRIPQDGRFKMSISHEHSIDFRISTLPTLNGEKIVMRILDPEATALDVNTLGFEDFQKKQYLNAINSSQGIVLVTGPTGSGKTISLYSALRILNTPDKNISTVEDPVEIYMEGINQVQVNTKTGMTFSSALRAFLRQDPDIMMVGEVRDLETAEIAIKAAQTGHLVLSTLHTNSAPETLSRLSNMGVKSFNIASTVIMVMAQRLARRLCPNCKKRVEIPEEALLKEGFTKEEVPTLELYGPGSCGKCTKGYKGRVGIYEVMPISEEMGRLIMEECNALQLADQARKEGISFLRGSGLLKVKQGVTSLEELNRIITV